MLPLIFVLPTPASFHGLCIKMSGLSLLFLTKIVTLSPSFVLEIPKLWNWSIPSRGVRIMRLFSDFSLGSLNFNTLVIVISSEEHDWVSRLGHAGDYLMCKSIEQGAFDFRFVASEVCFGWNIFLFTYMFLHSFLFVVLIVLSSRHGLIWKPSN